MQDEQPPNNLQQQSPSTLKPKKRLSLQVVAIAVLGTLFLATAGVLAYVLVNQDSKTDETAQTKKINEEKTTPDENSTEENIDNKDSTPTIKDEYEGWHIFSKHSDDTYARSYDFKYPDGWEFVSGIDCNIAMASSRSAEGMAAEGSDNVCFHGHRFFDESPYPEYPNDVPALVDSYIQRGFVKFSTTVNAESTMLQNNEGDMLVRVASDPASRYGASVTSCISTDSSLCEKILNSVISTKY